MNDVWLSPVFYLWFESLMMLNQKTKMSSFQKALLARTVLSSHEALKHGRMITADKPEQKLDHDDLSLSAWCFVFVYLFVCFVCASCSCVVCCILYGCSVTEEPETSFTLCGTIKFILNLKCWIVGKQLLAPTSFTPTSNTLTATAAANQLQTSNMWYRWRFNGHTAQRWMLNYWDRKVLKH